MNAPSIADTVQYLARAYPRQEFDHALYQRELEDCPPELLAAAMRDLLRAPHEWVPQVGHIRFAIAERLLNLPDEREAEEQIAARIEWARTRSEGDVDAPKLHPLVKEAVNHVGGWYSLRNSDRPEVVRGQLLRFYRDARAAEVRECAAKDFTKR